MELDDTVNSLVGATLADTYVVDRVVGVGAGGTVYAARHQRLNREVAVKVLRNPKPQALARFQREIETISRFRSRHIAFVTDCNSLADGTPFFVMELLDGEDLGVRLARVGKLSLQEARRMCEQVATALAEAHAHGVVHRDLKPENIFICKSDREEVVKVIDFGISKVQALSPMTVDGQLIGTPHYMSPEQLATENDEVDERADIYALAAVLYRALSGRTVHQADSLFALVKAATRPAEPLAAVAPDIPRPVSDAIQTALSVDKRDRPRSVTEFFNELDHAIRSATRDNATTPTGTIAGTVGFDTLLATTGMVLTPLWRGSGAGASVLRFSAPPGGFDRGGNKQRSLTLTPDKDEFCIGKHPDAGNDLVLHHRKVSRLAVRVLVRDGRVYLRRRGECNVPIMVGMRELAREEERPLHHGQVIKVSVVPGRFLDGRYVPTDVPAGVIDEETGLMGHDGLAWEVRVSARRDGSALLVVGTPRGELSGSARAACAAALAIHACNGAWPVARFGSYVGLLLENPGALGDIAAAAAAAGVPLTLGHLPVGQSADQARARIEEAVGALDRMAALSSAGAVVDLAAHRLELLPLGVFVTRAAELARDGGEIGLLALSEQDQLVQLGSDRFQALGLELLQAAGRAAGRDAIFCQPTGGAVAFASADAAEPIARQVASEWHTLEPIRGEVIEVARNVALQVVAPDKLSELQERAITLGSEQGFASGIESLPLPIAHPARRALEASTDRERGAALIAMVEATWRLLACGLRNMAALARVRVGDIGEPTDGLAEPWYRHASAYATALRDIGGRVGELVEALFGGAGHAALETARRRASETAACLTEGQPVAPTLPALRQAIADMVVALRPLKGWTLAAVTRVDQIDLQGSCVTVGYLDHTGSYERGTPRRVTLVKELRVGTFVYLARFSEGIIVPLEPFLRRRRTDDGEELYWATDLITAPGSHRYRGVVSDHGLEDEVTVHQLLRLPG